MIVSTTSKRSSGEVGIEARQTRIDHHDVELILFGEKLTGELEGLARRRRSSPADLFELGHQGETHQVLVFDNKGSVHGSASRSIRVTRPPNDQHMTSFLHLPKKGMTPSPFHKTGVRRPCVGPLQLA